MERETDRFSDGFIVEVGDKVDYDSEATFYKAPSKVGDKAKTVTEEEEEEG